MKFVNIFTLSTLARQGVLALAIFILGINLHFFTPACAIAEDESIIKAVAAGLTVNEGNPKGGTIYVIGYPTCSWLHRLYNDSRKFINDVEFRWFFYPPANSEGTDQAAFLAQTRDPKMLEQIMNGKRSAPSVQSDNKYIRAFKTNRTIFLDQVRSKLGKVPSPTLVYLDSGGVTRVERGYPGDQLGNLVAALAAPSLGRQVRTIDSGPPVHSEPAKTPPSVSRRPVHTEPAPPKIAPADDEDEFRLE